jgi:TetR/AcrR family transcriptional regulator, transcriptional repressor for nem operon
MVSFMHKATVTRLSILQKAFELIYTKGYQTTSVDDILATTQVTKGAFYYHFKNKDEMGLAVVEEILKPAMLENFIKPLLNAEDPVKGIYQMMKNLLLENPNLLVQYGCPAGNLTQEMAPWNKAFTKALAELTSQWQGTLQQCINNGKKRGQINKEVNAEQVAFFVMSGYWGIRNLGRLSNSKDCYKTYLKGLQVYLKKLE